MTMTPEEIEALAAEMLKQQKEASQEEPAPEPPKQQQAPEQSQPFDANELVSKLTEVFDSRDKKSSNEAMQVLFDQQVVQAVQTQPGFGDFLDQTDDYGNVRRENLNNMEDYKSKTDTLAKLKSSFAEASANTPGRKPVVNTREREMAKNIEGKYEDVWKRWESGEIQSEQQFAEEHAKIMAEETATLVGQEQ